MSGSTRSLSKALDAFFGTDAADDDWSELQSSIDLYLEKHNTISAIRGNSVSEVLLGIYDTHIIHKLNIRRECSFLDVVIKLLPVLNLSEVKLWLQTYTKPALDSAGYDLVFVEKSRGFLKRITGELMETADLALKGLRLEICQFVIRIVVDIYTGKDVSMIKLVVPLLKDQEFLERSRFIEENCFNFLRDFGFKSQKMYFEILNDYMTLYRLETLCLISALVAITTESDILQTPLFENILDGLLLELNDRIIVSELSIIVMLIPQFPSQVSQFLTKLFTIHLRICCWEDIKRVKLDTYENLISQRNIKFDLFPVEEESYILKHDHELSHLATILYGLFPLHFCQFVQDPLKVVESEPKYAIMIDSIIIAEEDIKDKLKTQFKCFLVHPKFLKFTTNSLEKEFNNPTCWMNSKNNSIEIAVECFSLNPDIIITDVLKNHQLLQDRTKPDFSMNLKSLSSESSFTGGMYMNIKEGPASKVFANYNRKLSIVPTNLILDGKRLSETSQSVKFLDYKFGETSSNTEESTKDPLVNLFSTHERLYHKTNLTSPPQSHSSLSNLRIRSRSNPGDDPIPEFRKIVFGDEKEENKNEVDSIVTTELKPSTQSSSYASINNKATFSNDPYAGSSIDFYHREILLLKNELEFSSYMKHLNKFNYIKLKSTKLENNNNEKAVSKSLVEEMRSSAQDLTTQFNTKADSHQVQLESLVNKLNDVQKENKELTGKLNDLRNEYRIIEENYEHNVKKVIVEKDYELENLRNKLEYLQSVKENQPAKPKDRIQEKDISVNEFEAQLVVANETIALVQEVNEKLRSELANSKDQYEKMIKSYETKVHKAKADVQELVSSYVKQFENRNAQLQGTVYKYEALLEEKNNKILHLSATRPIGIPGINREAVSNEYLDMDSSGNSSTPNSYLPMNAPNIFPFPNYLSGRPTNTVNNTTVLQQPTLRGRGGYQKRSKKM